MTFSIPIFGIRMQIVATATPTPATLPLCHSCHSATRIPCNRCTCLHFSLIGKYISFHWAAIGSVRQNFRQNAEHFQYAKPNNQQQQGQQGRPGQSTTTAARTPAVNCQSSAACRAFGLQFVKCLSRGFSFGRLGFGACHLLAERGRELGQEGYRVLVGLYYCLA